MAYFRSRSTQRQRGLVSRHQLHHWKWLREPEHVQHGEAVIDWSMPIGRDAMEVKRAADASLPFAPLVPSDALGSPSSIQVTPGSYPVDHTQIAWVYGSFDVTEEVVDSAAFEAEWSGL